jgi:hypothetical protein
MAISSEPEQFFAVLAELPEQKLTGISAWLIRNPTILGFPCRPLGLVSQTKPHHYRELCVSENKTDLPYAWNILNPGVSTLCSLGPYGLRDNVLDGVHLCMTVKLLRLNTMGALNTSVMHDAARPDLDKKSCARWAASPIHGSPPRRSRLFPHRLE